MKIFLTVVITIVALIVIGIILMYSGTYSVAAMNPPGALESWFFSTVADNSVEHHAKGIKAPPLDGAAMIDTGFMHYSGMCAGCHGAPGIQPRGMSRYMNPAPPDLAEAVSDLSDAEIYWIVKNGIKMTAMPSYAATHEENELWEMVSFVRLLPKMTPEQYQEYKNRLGEEERR